jgi:hypothetical protein
MKEVMEYAIPLLVRRGMRMAYEFPYCISHDFLHPCE